MFTLSKEEQKKLDEWLSKKDLKKYCGAIGGRFTYCFTPTSLGTAVSVKDSLDKDEIDLTNYNDW